MKIYPSVDYRYSYLYDGWYLFVCFFTITSIIVSIIVYAIIIFFSIRGERSFSRE